MRTVRSSYGQIPHLVTPSSRNRYLLTCPCKTYNMFDLCHHALAASADIGIVMEYLMEVVKKFEQKKQKKLSSYSITNAYKSTLTVSQLGKKKNEFNKPNSKRLKKNDDFFMKTAASAGRIEKNYNTQTPSSNCSESSAEISFSGHSLSGNQGSSTFSQNSATKNSQILGYQTSFEGNETSNTPFLISSQSHSLTSPNSTHIPETIQSCQLSENSFAQTFYDQNNPSQFNQHQQTHMPLILPRLQNDLFPCLNLRPDNIYTQQGKTLLTTPIIPPTPSNSLLSPQTSDWSSSSSPYQYELIFLPANVSKCYGCSQSFAEKIQASSIQHSYEAQRSTYLRCGHYVLKNNYFAEQLLIAITLLGLSSLCTYIALLGQKLL